MKIEGHTNYKLNEEVIVIPRTIGDDFVFKAKAIMDLDEFDALCPVPEPPSVIAKGGVKQFDFTNQAYLDALQSHASKRISYFVIKSLQATPGLTWDKVIFGDPNTWHLYKEELKDAGFNYLEVQRIEAAVFSANCLNEDKVEAARQNFLRAQVAIQKESSGQMPTQNSSQSGEPANASE